MEKQEDKAGVGLVMSVIVEVLAIAGIEGIDKRQHGLIPAEAEKKWLCFGDIVPRVQS